MKNNHEATRILSVDWTLKNYQLAQNLLLFLLLSILFKKKSNPVPIFFLSSLRRWVYFLGAGEEGHFFSPLLTCKSISIVKVATEDGSGFGGDCRGSR